MAGDVIAARQANLDQLEGFETSKSSLAKVVKNLESRLREYDNRRSALKSQLAQIDAQATALNAMKEASTSMGDSSATLDENIEKLEENVNDLFAETQVELLGEGEKWDASASEREIDSVDAFINATQEPGDTLSEIDRILGSK